jgi:hypothetical protein
VLGNESSQISVASLIKWDLIINPNISHAATILASDLSSDHCLCISLDSTLPHSLCLAMAASHPHHFQPFVTNKKEICKLVENYFLPDHVMLQWRPAAGEDIPTPNTNEIVAFSSFLQHRFGLPAYNFPHPILVVPCVPHLMVW